MTDQEFAARVYVKLAMYAPQALQDERVAEKLFEIIESVRGIEREEESRRMMFLESRQDIHPVCKY